MRLSIVHRTAYQYDAAVSFGIQYLRLTPYANASQRVIRWTIEAPGALTRWTDAFGNLCDTLIFDEPGDRIEIVAMGEVDTTDTSGVLPDEQGGVPVETYLRPTPLTANDETVADFAAPHAEAVSRDRLDAVHGIASAIRDRVDYREGTTDVQSSASQALENGFGVCQDHAHVFIAVCRALDVPARYVSGYLHVADRDTPEPAGHAWAAAWVERLGWISFDVANRTCGTESYVGTAIGPDYDSACPVRGIREGGEPAERLSVSVDVREARRPGT